MSVATFQLTVCGGLNGLRVRNLAKIDRVRSVIDSF
jgi:hypothetical protein